MDTDYPKSGDVTLRVRPQSPAKFRLALRVPGWAKGFKATIAGQTRDGTPGQFLNLERDWKLGDTVKVAMDLNEHLVSGGASYPGYFAFMRGPQVLTLVAGKDGEANLDRAAVKANVPTELAPAPDFLPGGWIGGQAYTSPALAGAAGCALVPFGDAGQPGLPTRYRTWIRLQPGTGIPVPATPSGLKATALTGNRIQLAWTDNSRDEDGFRVERRREDVGMWFHVKSTAADVRACVDDAVNVVLPGKTYTYRVAAYNAGGPSAYSEEATVTTPAASPGDGASAPPLPAGGGPMRLPKTDSHWRRVESYVEYEPDTDYQHAPAAAREAFGDLKYGIRIHWGLYSMLGVEASWDFLKMPPEKKQDYINLYKTFNPTGFNADEWMDLFKRNGVRVFAFTAKHHDGFSLYDTKARVRQCVNWTAPEASATTAITIRPRVSCPPARKTPTCPGW